MKVKSLKEFLSGIDSNTDIIVKISYEDGREEASKIEDIFHQGNEIVLCVYKDNEASYNGYNDNYGYDEEDSIAGNYRDY